MSIKSDRKRGAQDSWQAFELLRARWPKAFPAKAHEVRPLVNVMAELQEAFGWSPAYAKGVLSVWKARESYCRAVLALSENRVGLDGSLTEKTVDDKARAMASARLEQIAAKKALAAERRAKEAADRAAEATAPPPAPEPVPVPEPAPAPPAPVEAPAPEPERPRARKLLTIGPAAKEALLKRGLGTTEVVATIQRRAR